MICSNIKDIISIVGTLGTLWIAYSALNTWKKQLKGTDEYQLAKKVLKQIYQVQDSLENVRNPMIYLSKDEIELGNKIKEEMKIYGARLNILYDNYRELKILLLMLQAEPRL